MIPQCGTPQGYMAGCRGANCANHQTNLMTCTEAHLRYQWDYTYIKQVDSGTNTAAKETFVTPQRKPKNTGPRVRTPYKKTHKFRPVLPHEHGTPNGYAVGCRDGCPGNDNGVTCRQAASAMHLAATVRRRARDAHKTAPASVGAVLASTA